MKDEQKGEQENEKTMHEISAKYFESTSKRQNMIRSLKIRKLLS